MTLLAANGIEIEYDTFGESSDRVLLMVMGLGAQMVFWDDDFCQQLANTGHYLIRFDNRDIGLSTKFEHEPVPDMAQLANDLAEGITPHVPYTLDDMADDGFALLTALDIEKAHICGASMGGMIVQAMAIRNPARVKSITSIMSSSGDPDLPPASMEAVAALTKAPPTTREDAIESSIETLKVIGSPGFPLDEERVKARAARSYDRSFYPAGMARQMAAIVAHGNRKPQLCALELPALVIHGNADPLVPVEAGKDTHAAIRGSELLLIDGMGHDLPKEAWPQIVAAITGLTTASE
jgi:pimeloyl-ACP methyl ester carboxylesterase|tara:strand:- start:39 stop:923 length:885 start_codon:yes stop_codon:yes gene_type:complete